jgi:hypothetical protein
MRSSSNQMPQQPSQQKPSDSHRRIDRGKKIHRRKSPTGTNRRRERSIRIQTILHQKERRTTTTSTRLPETKRPHDQKPLPTSPHPGSYRSGTKSRPVHQVRRQMGLQQRTNQTRRRMESSLHHSIRALPTTSNVLRTHQFTSHLPSNDEPHLPKEIREGWLVVYMDDLLIATEDNLDFHKQCVRRVLQKLLDHDLYLKLSKCEFHKRRIEYLGVVLEHGQVQMDPTKIKGVADWARPQNAKDVRSFLGFTGFYRYFIKDYSKIARPLIDLTKKNLRFDWTEKQQLAFERLKTLMCAKPVLRQPDYDKTFTLSTDASGYGVGAVLAQEGLPDPRTGKPRMHPVAYYSATFTPTERNYDVYERELLAVVKALKNWRPHLAATEQPITILTDHANLLYTGRTPRTSIEG